MFPLVAERAAQPTFPGGSIGIQATDSTEKNMFEKTENTILYKWDPRTYTGFKLRYDAEGAAKGGHCCFHVEDWTFRSITNEWPCEDLEEALEVLNHFFAIDVVQERERLASWLPVTLAEAA
jgi:hypothetical protein